MFDHALRYLLSIGAEVVFNRETCNVYFNGVVACGCSPYPSLAILEAYRNFMHFHSIEMGV